MGALRYAAITGMFELLWATRLTRMVVAAFAVATAVAAIGLVAGGPGLFVVLALGATGLVVPALAATIVVDLDGRPNRTLRPWKLLLLIPLPLVGVQLWQLVPTTPQPQPASSEALLLALLALAASLPALLLLVRRRESAP